MGVAEGVSKCSSPPFFLLSYRAHSECIMTYFINILRGQNSNAYFGGWQL